MTLYEVLEANLGRLVLPFSVSLDSPDDTDLESLINEDKVGCIGGGGCLLFTLVTGVDCRLE